MNYYEQFYDDLEFAEEEEEPVDDSFDARKYATDPGYGYEEEWTHRDQKYPQDRGQSRGHSRGQQEREAPRDFRERSPDAYYTRGYDDRSRGHEEGSPDDWDEDSEYDSGGYAGRGWGHEERGQGYWDRGRGYGQRGRGYGDRGRGFGDRGRGYWERGRGFGDRGRGQRGRGRGFNDRGRGDFDRGRGRRGQRGGVKASLAMNFVKAKDPDPVQPVTDPAVSQVTQDQPQVPVCAGYGYGAGSDFEQFGSVTPEGTPVAAQQPPPAVVAAAADPGVPGLAPPVSLPPTPTQPANTGHKVITAVVKPMYNFVKAKSEFKSTDVAFHETTSSAAAMAATQQQKQQQPPQPAVAMPTGQKAVLQTFDVATAFYSGAKDGRNPKFDMKFNRLRDAVKACCRIPSKNSIEIIHMAVDKVKMKITDINKPGGRTIHGQVMFLCKLEIDGVFVAEGSASNKKMAKHEAYNNGKMLFEGGPVYVVESSPGVFEVKATTPAPGTTVSGTSGPVQPTSGTTGNTVPGGSTYSKPKIVFHTPKHPLADKPLQFASSQQSSAAAGALATKLLNFVKEGCSQSPAAATTTASTTPAPNTVPSTTSVSSPATTATTPSTAPVTTTAQQTSISTPAQPQTSKPFTSQSAYKHSPAIRPNISDPGRNMLKRALQSANINRLRYKKQKMGPTVLDDLSQFVIYDTTMVNPTNTELSILHLSANQNKVVLKIEHEVLGKEDDYAFLCTTYLGDHMVASTTGTSKEDAKQNSAREALYRLKEICYTIRVKQDVDNDNDGVSKDELTADNKPSDVIGDSNIGNMMLKKMGWTGGGMGKHGKGIAEPVKTEMIIGREGLGLKAEKGLDKDFNKRVTEMLESHIKTDDQRDLHFSSELTKEERAIIHQIGQKLGLKTNSKGKGANRYLIVSRKRSVRELLEHVLNSGGSTDKYEIMEPKNPVGDPRYRESVSYGHSKQ